LPETQRQELTGDTLCDGSELDPVGQPEIAERLGAPVNTVYAWIHKRMLPPARWRIANAPVWNWPEIAAWAIERNRLAPQCAIPSPRCGQLHELVAASDIAARLGVTRRMVYSRVQRGRMPPPRWTAAGRGVWLWDDVKDQSWDRPSRTVRLRVL
jgi:predicted DNA-binding transcriptional regulator AlpA